MITRTPDWAAIRISLVDWFKLVSGLDRVIWANQTARRLTRPYATLNIIAVPKPLGLPYRIVTFDTEYVETVLEDQEFTLSATVYADSQDITADALSIMQRANQVAPTFSSLEYLRDNYIVLVDREAVQNIDEQLGDRWERRAMQDYRMRIRPSTLTNDIPTIAHMSFTGDVLDNDESIPITGNN